MHGLRHSLYQHLDEHCWVHRARQCLAYFFNQSPVVVPAAVEQPVYQALGPASQRLERAGGQQGQGCQQ
jgi:hypothetical protein